MLLSDLTGHVARGRSREPLMEVPVQFFQSVIGIEVATTGALLFQVRYFEARDELEGSGRPLPDARVRLLMAAVLGATVFGSLFAIATGGQTSVAIAVTVGLAISVLPILLRVLPPLVSSSRSDTTVAGLGLILFVLIVVTVVVLLSS
jgi:hypothetical protein